MAYTSPTFSTNNQYIKYRIVVNELSQSIENNRTTINVKVQAWRTNSGYTTDDDGTCYCNINGANFSNSWSYGQKPITYNSYTTLFDKDVVIPHETDGSKTLYVSSYIRHDRFSSNSQGFNVTLTQIPRAATFTSAPEFSDTVNPVIGYSNPAGDVVDSIEACISLSNTTPVVSPIVDFRTLTKTGSSYAFTLTQTEIDNLLAATPNSNTLTVYYILKTVISGSTYYSIAPTTFNVTGALPVITGASYEDTNSYTIAITGDDSQIIQNNSTVDFTFTSLEAVKDATLSSIAVTIDGVTVSQALSGSTASNVSLAFGVINSISDVTAEIVLTDSRGNEARTTVSVTMLEWSLPTATISLARRSNYYPETDLKVTANYSSLDGNNQITISYQYKETGAGTWSSPVTIQDGVTTTITLDNTKSYDIKIIVEDLIGSNTYTKALQIGIPIFFIDRILRSIGIGTFPDQPNMLAVDRRLNLKNTMQETVMDLWSTVTDQTSRTASFYIYNQLQEILVKLAGATNGQGGFLQLNRGDGTPATYLDPNYILLRNTDGEFVLRLWVGGNKDGVIDVMDAQGNVTFQVEGATGKVTTQSLVECNHVKSSGSVVEVVDTAFNSGNKTFNNDSYSSLTVIAKTHSSGSYNTATIPLAFLGSSNKQFCISDDTEYITFSVKLDNGVITVTWGSGSASGSSIEKVYAHY